jgi:eukaryotic-like serine/threonine-protein kinase
VTTSTTDPTIGRLIDGRYRVRSRIARGGMATVYLATDLRLERRVAIKIMHGHLADDAQFKQRFIQEARSAARLAHPNVVNVFDQGQDRESAYLVMEYLPGITLRDLLAEHDALTAEQTMDVVEAMLSGLAAAHKAGIVHRDLKPENVLLADDGRIKLGDFGLARAATANTATGAALLGTIAYLSPELVTRGVADTRSDIYAVGIMMYEMLTGEQPYKGDQPMQIAYRHANDTVPAPSSENPTVPPELDELVLWATDKDPEQRPRDARAMLEQLYNAQNLLRTDVEQQQRTRVLPAAPLVPPKRQATAETQVLGARPKLTVPVIEATGPVATLERTARTRRGRMRWLLALVLLVAGVAAGTGLYFGVGPGAGVTVPRSLVQMDPTAAAAALTDLGLESATRDTASLDVAQGLVAGTSPDAGEVVAPGSTVTLLVSTGPEQLPLPAVVGQDVDAATAQLASFAVGDPIYQFSSDVPERQVMDVLLVGDDESETSIAAQPTYGEQQPMRLLVSAGPLPDVAGLSVSEAEQQLTADGLFLDDTRDFTAYDNTGAVPEGGVLGIQLPENGIVRNGDTLALRYSRGRELIAIPEDIEDGTIADAVAALQAIGLVADVDTILPQLFWDYPAATIDEVSPGPEELVQYGSTVTITGDQ